MNKIVTLDNLIQISKKIRAQNKKIVMCHGVFDLLHYGHIHHFNESKKLGDTLIVSITSSKFVNKGPGRPYFDNTIRAKSLEALKSIDYVFINEAATPINLINSIKPNVYSKGQDYKKNSLDLTKNIKIEKEAVRKNNGVIFITEGITFSSSNLLNLHFDHRKDKKKNFLERIKKKFSFEEIVNIIEGFESLQGLVIGETIIDQYNFCEAVGKSGKEPVMVFKDLKTETYLGGAPYIARHLSSFSKKINLISMIGNDKKHEQFIKKNLEKNIHSQFLKRLNKPTITKKRIINKSTGSKVYGVYDYSDDLLAKVEEDKIIKMIDRVKKIDFVIIADFGHEMITKKIIQKLKSKTNFLICNSQLNAINRGYHNLRKYNKTKCIVINESEMRYELRNKEDNIEKLMLTLKKKMQLEILIVTRGAKGVTLIDKKNRFYKCGAYAKNIIDKVGSGDTLMAVLANFLKNKIDFELSLLISSVAAGFAVETFGNSKIVNKKEIIKSLYHILK